MNVLEQIRAKGLIGTTEPIEPQAAVTPIPMATEKSFYHTPEELEEYRRTATWQRLRLERLAIDGYICILCNAVANTVHHRRYPEVMGQESVEKDLVSLCQRCHFTHHECTGLDEYRTALVQEEWKKCPLCRQKIRKLNPHRMCKQKVWMLSLLAKAKNGGDEWVKVTAGREMEIGDKTVVGPYRVQLHGARLCWFGLAERGPHRSGIYRITEKGLKFLSGQEVVPKVIYCHNGEVVEESPETVTINEVRGVVLDKDYWDNYASVQATPSEVRKILGQAPVNEAN